MNHGLQRMNTASAVQTYNQALELCSRAAFEEAEPILLFTKSVKSDCKYTFDVVGIIILMQQKFFQSDPVLIRPKLASVLI